MESSNNFIIIQRSIYIIIFFEKVEISKKIKENDTFGIFSFFFFSKNFEDSETFSQEIIDLFATKRIIGRRKGNSEEEETVRKFQVKQITLNVRAV